MQRLALLLALVFLCAAPVAAQELTIVGARIYTSPDAAPIPDGTITMRDGKIIEVGPSAKVKADNAANVIDGHGLVVTAGFWNSHVHLLAPPFVGVDAKAASDLLEAMLTRWGFTSVFDIASIPGGSITLRKRIVAGEVRGPNILTVDAPFYPNNGVPIYVREITRGQPSFEIGTPQAAAERVKRQIESGADGVKIFAGSIVGPPVGVLPMPLDAAKAIVAAAHVAHKPVFAHPSNQEGLNVSIDSGVDILAHTTPDDGIEWTPELIKRLKKNNMALIPTLTLWDVELKKNNVPQDRIDAFIAVAQRQLKAYSDAGGQILFGTDVGYIDVFDTTQEYRLMAGAGLTWRQILTSLTTAPAKRFGFKNKGKIAAGADADLTVLAADPAVDATAFAKVACTIRAGKVIYGQKC
jgi:imidazolonepropionase-like amidohydrolase